MLEEQRIQGQKGGDEKGTVLFRVKAKKNKVKSGVRNTPEKRSDSYLTYKHWFGVIR